MAQYHRIRLVPTRKHGAEIAVTSYFWGRGISKKLNDKTTRGVSVARRLVVRFSGSYWPLALESAAPFSNTNLVLVPPMRIS